MNSEFSMASNILYKTYSFALNSNLRKTKLLPCSYFSSKPIPPKKPAKLIILYDSDGKILSNEKNFTDAEAIAKRRGLSLIKIENPINYHKLPAYSLVPKNVALKIEEDMIDREETVEGVKCEKKVKKGGMEPKHISYGTNVSEHDYQIKLKWILKWLKHDHPVSVVITNHDPGNKKMLKKSLNLLEEDIKSYGTVKEKQSPKVGVKIKIMPLGIPELIVENSNSPFDESEQKIDSDLVIDQKEIEEMVKERLKKNK